MHDTASPDCRDLLNGMPVCDNGWQVGLLGYFYAVGVATIKTSQESPDAEETALGGKEQGTVC